MGSLPNLKNWAPISVIDNSDYFQEQNNRAALRAQRGFQRRNEVIAIPVKALKIIVVVLLLSATLALSSVVYRVAKVHKNQIVEVLPSLQNSSFPKAFSNVFGTFFSVSGKAEVKNTRKKVRYYL